MIFSIRPRECTDISTVNAHDSSEEMSESSPGLPAVRAAIDRLLILSVNIRRSARLTHRLRHGSRNTQDESMCCLLAQARYPNARKSLCGQLGASIHVRGISLQYMQEHNKKLAYRRDDRDDLEILEKEEEKPKEQAKAPVVSSNKDTGPKKQKATRAPETLPSIVSPSAIVRINRTRRNPSSTVISSGSAVQDGQPDESYYPPQPRQRDGKRYQSCAICAMPLEPLTLKKRAWKYVPAFPCRFISRLSDIPTELMLTKISSLTPAFPRTASSLLSTSVACKAGWIICGRDTR